MISYRQNPGILQFESFRAFENIVHFTTTRHGGCSVGTFESFNLSYYSGDVKEHTDINRGKLCEELELKPDMLFVPYQTHKAGIAILEQDFMLAEKEQQCEMLREKDALLTSRKNVCIAVSTADCVPILLYAADQQVIGAIHAGWRGTCLRIVQSVIEEMKNRYGCDPTNMYVAIGPSIGPDAFEVGEEVYRAFCDTGFDPKSCSFIHPVTEKHHINLWETNRRQLLESGVLPDRIEVSDICTYRHSDTFFSARKSGIVSGRMLTGICLV